MARTLTRTRRQEADADDDDTNTREEPRARGRAARTREETAQPTVKIGKGWSAANRIKEATSDFASELKVTDEAVLIHILDDEPFAAWLQHWIERRGRGQRSWVCLEDKCPLCDQLGDKPKPVVAFNVVDLSDPDDPVVKVWKVGSQVAEILHNFSKDKKSSPINRDDLYFSVSKTRPKSNGAYVYTVSPVKARDVLEDWGIDPLSDDDLEAFEEEAYDDSIVRVSTRRQLLDVVEEQNGE